MFCRCSNPTMVGEIDENANSTNWKNNLYTVKPKKSNNLVKPRLKGNWKWATIVRKYQCAKGMWTVELRADGVLKEFRKPGMWVWRPFWFWRAVCMLVWVLLCLFYVVWFLYCRSRCSSSAAHPYLYLVCWCMLLAWTFVLLPLLSTHRCFVLIYDF